MIELLNIDCMTYMAGLPDKAFDLAICDPPYGIGAGDYKRGGTQYGNSAAICKIYDKKDWDNTSPNQNYFNEVIRVSKNQIIWGANHFISKMPFDASGWIVWDKMTAPGSGSSAIAAHQMGFDFVGCEIDKDYYDAAMKRFKEQTAQLSML